MNRHYLSHAAKLGITDLWTFGDHRPVICRGKHLVYIWQPLSGVPQPQCSGDTIQVATTGENVAGGQSSRWAT